MNKINEISPLMLAFIGDSIHTAYVRTYILSKNVQTPKKIHNLSTSFCRAKSQAEALDFLTNKLSEEELDLVRRTRNTKNHNAPKNSNLEEYSKATCFEALIGFWYLTNQTEKMKNLLDEFMEKR